MPQHLCVATVRAIVTPGPFACNQGDRWMPALQWRCYVGVGMRRRFYSVNQGYTGGAMSANTWGLGRVLGVCRESGNVRSASFRLLGGLGGPG